MKTGYLITARLKSSRLKRKILLDIDGDCVLDKVIARCKQVKGIDKVILCTSINEQDAELEVYAKKHNIGFYRGSEDDVLKRLLDASRQNGIDRFLSITADNPLHSIKAAHHILEFDNKNQFDYIFTYNLPIGVSPYFIRTDALDVAVYMKKLADTEIWGPFVNRPDFFAIGNLHLSNINLPKNLRITCDYEQDYNFICALYENLNGNFPDVNEIEEVFESASELFEINAGIVQRMPDAQLLSEINRSFDDNMENGKKYAQQNGFKLFPKLIEETVTENL
jgi:spore coat polysaccharide biosynthesis protein SpsF